MNRDMVVGIVGAAILVAGMIGVFAYEQKVAPVGGAGGASGTDDGSPIVQPASVTGTSAAGQATTKVVNVTSTHASFANFTVSWTPGANSKDTVKVDIAGPNGAKATQQGDTGKIVVSVPITAGTAPTGAWNVTVTFVTATLNTPVPPPVSPPVTPPAGVDASISWTAATQLA